MKKQLRVLGVLVCLLPLMTGCLSQTKDKQDLVVAIKLVKQLKRRLAVALVLAKLKSVKRQAVEQQLHMLQ